MLNFTYYNPAKIVFGRESENNVAQYIIPYGKRVLLHYGQGSIKKSGLYDRVAKNLKENGIYFTELSGVKPNPRLSLVREGIEICKKENIDLILAVGGGSVIDSAKAIAVGVENDRDIWDFFEDRSLAIDKALPIGVILTIAAAGSETSTSSVITNDTNGLKRGISSTAYIPKFAVLNPQLTCTLSSYQTACGCVDMVSHMFERYFCNVDNVDYTDRMIEAAIGCVIDNSLKAIAEPDNYDVRAEIMWAGTQAHNNILGVGRVWDGGCHQIEHELSGMFDITHGEGLAIVIPAWMKYVSKRKNDKFLQLAKKSFFVDTTEEMIEKIENWYRKMGLKTRLSEIGINEDSFEKLADQCFINRDTIGKFAVLDRADFINIMNIAK